MIKKLLFYLFVGLILTGLQYLPVQTALAAADDKLSIQIKEKNNKNWNKVYGQVSYSYMSTTIIRAWINDDRTHPVFSGNASGVVTFNHGKSSSDININLAASAVPRQVEDAANKAKDKGKDRRIESFVYPPFMNNVIDAYRLKYSREEKRSGYDCYVYDFFPNTLVKGYMTGKVWIDKKSLMMVRYEGSRLIPPQYVSSNLVTQEFFYEPVHDLWLSRSLYITGSANMLILTINGYINSEQTEYKFN